MSRRPPRSTRTDPLFPYTTLVRSWMRSKLSVMTAFTPSRLVPLAAQSREEPDPYSLPPNTTSGVPWAARSEEHTTELQSLMRTSYAVFCLKKKQRSRIVYNSSVCFQQVNNVQLTSHN